MCTGAQQQQQQQSSDGKHRQQCSAVRSINLVCQIGLMWVEQCAACQAPKHAITPPLMLSSRSASAWPFRLTGSDRSRHRWPTRRPRGWRRPPGHAPTRPRPVVASPVARPTHLPVDVREVRRRSPPAIPAYTNSSKNASFRLCNKLSASSALGE